VQRKVEANGLIYYTVQIYLSLSNPVPITYTDMHHSFISNLIFVLIIPVLKYYILVYQSCPDFGFVVILICKDLADVNSIPSPFNSNPKLLSLNAIIQQVEALFEIFTIKR